MIRKWVIGVLGIASCAAVGMASAAEPGHAAPPSKPTVLSLAQMDNVTAGHGTYIHGFNVQINNNVQVAVVLGNNNSVNQGALQVNYAELTSPLY